MEPGIRSKLDAFFSNFKKTNLKKREIIIKPDDEPLGVYYLINGVIRMYSISIQGEEITINTFRPVSFFPMGWVLNNNVSHYYFEAATSSEVIRAPKEEFLKFLQQEPEVMLDLLKRIYKGLDGYFLRMEYLMSGNAQSRLVTEILIYAKRFGEKSKNGTVVNLKLTEKDIASQTGITRETVSRELSKLKEKKLLTFEKNTLVINDLVKLEDELASL